MEKICPKCKSKNVRWEDNNLYGTRGSWVCKDCGFNLLVFPEKLEREMKKQSEGRK